MIRTGSLAALILLALTDSVVSTPSPRPRQRRTIRRCRHMPRDCSGTEISEISNETQKLSLNQVQVPVCT